MGTLSAAFRGLSGAVELGAAARGGYLQGQQQGEERRRREEAAAAERKRQSLIDETRLAMEKRQLTNSERVAKAAEARADDEELGVIDRPEGTYYYGKRSGKTRKATLEDGTPVPGKAAEATDPPKTRNTERGIEEWDPKTKTWKPTGHVPYHAPRTSSTDPADKAKKDNFERTRTSLAAVRGQISDTQRQLNAQEDADTQKEYTGAQPDTTRAHQLRGSLDSLKHVSDSISTDLQRQSRESGKANAGTGGLGLRPVGDAPAKQTITADQARYLKSGRSGRKWTDAEINARYKVTP